MIALLLLFAVLNSSVFCANNYGKIPDDLVPCIPTIDMIDASGKIPSGILAYNIIDLGSFDQCLSIKHRINATKTVRGKYCLMKIILPEDIFNPTTPIPKKQTYINEGQPELRIIANGIDPKDNSSGLIVGWCIPEDCPAEKVAEAVSFVLKKMDIEVKPVSHGMCQTEDDAYKKLEDSDWGVIGFFIAILVVMVISTIYDVYVQCNKKAPAHILLTAFSVKSNGQKLLTASNHPDQLPCLHGIRFISMMWVVLGHRYIVNAMAPNVNLKEIQGWVNNIGNMYILSAPVAVDSFFVLSGILIAYGFCLAKDKGIRFNIAMYYLHRYLRLTPVLAVVVLIHATILPYFGSGPFWPLGIFALKEFCVKHWWSPLVYAQNYYNTQEMCVGQTWYLAVDMQLFIISPIILIPLWRWPKYTMITSAVLVVGSMISSFVVTYHFDLPGFSISDDNVKYMDYYYITTHTRFGPWLMGLMLGYYLFKLKKDKNNPFTLHPSQVCFGWIVALALLFTAVFASHRLVVEHDLIANSFFNGMHRHAWALGLCWVIYACTQGYGGIINNFLSWPVFQILGRFTYTIYLVHLTSQYLIVASSRTSTYFTDFNTLYSFWGDLFLSLAIAICLTLSFESPMITIEKVLFKIGNKSKAPELPTHQRNIPTTSGQTNNAFVAD